MFLGKTLYPHSTFLHSGVQIGTVPVNAGVTIAEIFPRGKDSHAQHAVDNVAEWSSCTLMQLNAANLLDLKKCEHSFEPLFVSD